MHQYFYLSYYLWYLLLRDVDTVISVLSFAHDFRIYKIVYFPNYTYGILLAESS